MEDKKRCFRHAICCTPGSFFNQTKHAFFSTSLMFYTCAEVCAGDCMTHMLKPANKKTNAVNKKSNTCEEGEQKFSLVFINELEKQLYLKNC